MRRITLCVIAAFALAGIVLLVRDERPLPRMIDSEPTEEPSTPEISPASAPAINSEFTASEAHPLPGVLVDPMISIEKERRALTVFSAGQAVKTYLIALGSEPVGDKEREGDNRTPEGEFYVCTRNAESNYHRALGISYPNEEDAERGLHSGLITSREQRQLLDALRHYRQPPWKTALGGEIMIHGGGTSSDWTQGCIAMEDIEAEELFDAIPLGTRVQILP